MTRGVIPVAPDAAVEDAGRLMVGEKLSALPVMRGDRPIGIVTGTDVLRLFVRALGATEPSSRLDVQVGPDRSVLADVVRIVESTGTRISSNPASAVHALAANGYALRTPWRG